MNISINFTIPDPIQLLVYLVIGLVVALMVGGLARMRYGLGYLAATIFAILGAWVFASVLKLQVAGDINIAGVPIIEATIGALLFALLAVVLFARRRRGDVVVVE